MKTKLFTLAILFLLTLNFVSAENYRVLKISDNLGHTMNILSKVETIQDNFDFDTRVIFKEIKGQCNQQILDITPFIKPEAEVVEDLPVYKQ